MEGRVPKELNVAPMVFATALLLPLESPLLPFLSKLQPPEIPDKNDRQERKPRNNGVCQ